MVLSATRAGMFRAVAHSRLAVVVWLANLTLAAAAGIPGWLALSSILADRPGADTLRDGLRFGVVSDLVQMRPGLLSGLFLSALGLAGLALVVGAAVNGGALEVLATEDERPLGHRFGRGAGRFFGRFARAGVVTLVLGGALAGLVWLPFLAASRALRGSAWELGRFTMAGSGLAAAAFVLLLALLVLHAARVAIVLDDEPRVRSALWLGLKLVLRHPLSWLGTWGVNAGLVALALGAYLVVRGLLPATTAGLIVVMILVQQAFVLTRSWLRVALFGSEIALVEHLLPPLPEPEVEPEPSDEEAVQSEPEAPEEASSDGGSQAESRDERPAAEGPPEAGPPDEAPPDDGPPDEAPPD
jgi:hypothetical protein